jgi:hypothetical protein
MTDALIIFSWVSSGGISTGVSPREFLSTAVEAEEGRTKADVPFVLLICDKDHADDPMSFVPIFHSESNQI